MLVNLTDVFTSGHDDISVEASFTMDTVTYGSVSYQVCDKHPVFLHAVNIAAGKALVQGKTSFAVIMSCDRCLKDVKYEFVLDFEAKVSAPDAAEDTEEPDFMEGYHLNVDDLIYSEMVLNWPMKILCREDCKGICRICGKDLNTGACGCDTFVPSPGLAGIKEIFNANKEV